LNYIDINDDFSAVAQTALELLKLSIPDMPSSGVCLTPSLYPS